jgi:hypothetical protein
MALFGLGNFGEGFIEGLATSANKALQDDIKRINLRAEKVADFQVKRTVEAQEKRKKDLEEIEDALREAEGMFDKDDPRAAAYAASLLEEQGSASALKAFTKQIKDSNVYKSGQSLANFMEMAEKDMPTGTRSDYANAFLGAPSLPTDYRLPESAASAGAGNLLDAIGLKPDVSAMVSEQVSEQMSAMGIAEQAEITVSLPSGTFMKEKFTMGNMTPSKQLEYINQQIVNPNNTPERTAELQTMLEKTNKAILATGGIEDKIQVLTSDLSRQTGDEAKSTMEEIKKLKRTAALRAAEISDDPMDLINANINIALDEAEKTGNYDTYNELVKKKNRLGKPIDPENEIKEARQDLYRRVKTGEITEGSEEFNRELAAINKDESLYNTLYKDNDEFDSAEAARFGNIMEDAIAVDISDSLTGAEADRFKEIKTLLDSEYGGTLELLRKNAPELHKEYMAIVSKNKDIRDTAIKRVIGSIPKSATGAITNATYAAQSQFNYGGQAQAAAAKAVSEVQGDGAAVTGGEAPVVSAASADNLKKMFSDDEAGATKMVNAILTKGINMEAAIADAKAKGYSPAFISVLEQNKGMDSTMAKMAIEDAGMQTDKNETTQVMDIVDRFHSSALAPNVVAQPSKVNRLVREALGLGNTDRDKERASEIIEQARIRLVERDRKPKDNNRRASRTGQASGGLMSRG